MQDQNQQLQDAPPAANAEELRKKVDDLTAQIAEKDKKLVELSALSTEAETLKARNSELERKLLQNSGDKQTVEGLNQRIKTLEEDNARLVTQIQQKTAGGGETEKIAALTQENENLKKQIDSLKRNAADAAALAGELDKLRQENAGLKQKVAELEQQLAEARTVAENAPAKPAEVLEAAAVPAAPDVAPEPEDVPAQDITSMPVPAQEMNDSEDISEDVASASEAQRQEEQVRQSLNAPPVAAPPLAKQPSPPVEARISEDPYAPIPPQEELKSVEIGEDLQAGEITESGAGQPEKSDQKPSEEIAWNDTSREGYYQPSFSVRDVIAQAQIAPAADVRMVEKVSGSGKVAWQWNAGGVFGSAEQTPLADASGFDAGVREYLDKTQKRCAGDFAVEPDNSLQLAGSRVESYEIACVGKGVNSAAALLFLNKGGAFTVVAHETPADKMGDAMEIRDRLLKTISGS